MFLLERPIIWGTFGLDNKLQVRVTDDGTTTEAFCPVVGQHYIYKCSPVLISPSVAMDTISSTSQIGDIVNNSNDIFNPQNIARIRDTINSENNVFNDRALRISTYGVMSVEKNFSVSALTAGTLSLPTKNILKEFPTGDDLDFNVLTLNRNITVENGVIRSSLEKGPILSWSVSGDQSAKDSIDFFIIVSNKQQRKCLVGSCHRTPSDSFIFSDFSNKGFVGSISYSVIPVFLDGSQGTETSLGTIQMIDMNTKFKTGR